jgi:hypothetical protein
VEKLWISCGSFPGAIGQKDAFSLLTRLRRHPRQEENRQGTRRNWFQYRLTTNGKRYHSTRHSTLDPYKDGSELDEGTKYKWDWTVTKFDCINGGGESVGRESATQYGLWETDGDPSGIP